MAGILSSASMLLRYIKNIEKDGVAGGTLASIEDKHMQIIRADGSIMKMLGKYIVEPVAVVSDDLRDVEELDNILGLHMDMFTGYYMQVFDILKNHYGVSIATTIDTLATDNAGLSRIIASGFKEGILLATEDSDDMTDYLGDLLTKSDCSVTESGELLLPSHEGKKRRRKIKRHAIDENERHEVERKYDERRNVINSRRNRDTGDAFSKQQGKEGATDVANDMRRNRLLKVSKNRRHIFRNSDIDIPATGLSEAHKDLLIPNAIERTIQVSADVTLSEPGSDGKFYSKTIIIPIKIKLAVIFTSKENIVNAIETRSKEYSFSERVDEYRFGALSASEFWLATDIIKKYKKHKLRDSDTLLQIINSRELSSNSKILTNGFSGFEKFYNMYFISPEAKLAVERSIGRKLSSPNGKDDFLDQAHGLSVTVVDPDYERIQIMFRDTRGKTDLSFKNAIKKDSKGSDYGEIIKALMASKPPAF